MPDKIKWPLLLIIAVLMILAMLRLGVWQLDRAAQKQTLLDQVVLNSNRPEVALSSIASQLAAEGSNGAESSKGVDSGFRFRQVTALGRYDGDKSIYIDNQVVGGQVGYRVFTPLRLSANEAVILVNRGWIGIGESRAELPLFDTAAGEVKLTGRLNTPPAQPPLWDDDYAVAQGPVWAYLPIAEYATQMGLTVLPLVIELAPEEASNQPFKRSLAEINDEWVAKHHGYAFQWFAMALAFFIACVVLLVRQFNKQSISE